MTNYSELRRLAEAQPVKNWKRSAGRKPCISGERLIYCIEGPECVSDYEDWGFTGNAADFIAAANPAAVLELIAENERMIAVADLHALEMSGVARAKEELAEKLGCADEPRWKWLLSGADDLIKARDQLKAEVEALRAERSSPTSEQMLEMGRNYWISRHRSGLDTGAVKWVRDDESGALLVFTRGEYREQLLNAVYAIEPDLGTEVGQ